MSRLRSPRDRLVRRFVARSAIVRIATRSPAGNVDAIPIWFVCWRGRYLLGTRAANPVVRDLIHHPEVTLLFYGEQLPALRYALRVRGTATFRAGRPGLVMLALSAWRYILPPGALWNAWRHREQFRARLGYYGERGGGGGVVEITPATAEFLPLP